MDNNKPWVDRLREIKDRADNEIVGEKITQQKNAYMKLLLPIPKGGKYKTVRKMAKLLASGYVFSNDGVANFCLAGCLKVNFNNNLKMTKKIYVHRKQKYDSQIENCIRTLKKLWKPIGYEIKSIKGISRKVIFKDTLNIPK